MQHHRDLGTGRVDLGVTLVEHHLTEPGREPAQSIALWFATPCEGAGDDDSPIDDTDPGGLPHPVPNRACR